MLFDTKARPPFTPRPMRFPGASHTGGPGHDIFRPPAFASRSSDSRPGVGPSLRSAYRPGGRTPTGLPRSARTSCDRVGRPLCRGDDGAPPGRGHFPAGACRIAAASPCTPPTIPPAGISLNEASTKGSRVFARPIFPRLWPPGWNGPPLGSHPGLRTPPTRSRTTHARAGTGHRARTWNYSLNSSSVDLQSGSSLVTCDLVSQVA
jgi:hypothetical protein